MKDIQQCDTITLIMWIDNHVRWSQIFVTEGVFESVDASETPL